jgi:hypothetical protein
MNDGDTFKSIMAAGGKYISEGYSGDPIFNREGTQVGVGSWDHGCAQNNFPAV